MGRLRTTARPKLVLHSHQSYPVGHLSTMYWLGVGPGDILLNISSPGWAKHACNRLLIKATGRVSGTIRYGQIEIECGGQIFGDIQAEPAGELGKAHLP